MRNKVARIIDWIFEAPQGAEKFLLPIALIAWDFILVGIIANTLITHTAVLEEAPYFGTLIASWDFLFELIYFALEEELIFRIVPLILVMHFVRNRWLTLVTVIVSASVFGFIHGGVANIAIQGIGGLIYGVLFIKYSEQGRSFLAAGAVVVLMHIIFNVLQALTLASYGETAW